MGMQTYSCWAPPPHASLSGPISGFPFMSQPVQALGYIRQSTHRCSAGVFSTVASRSEGIARRTEAAQCISGACTPGVC